MSDIIVEARDKKELLIKAAYAFISWGIDDDIPYTYEEFKSDYLEYGVLVAAYNLGFMVGDSNSE